VLAGCGNRRVFNVFPFWSNDNDHNDDDHHHDIMMSRGNGPWSYVVDRRAQGQGTFVIDPPSFTPALANQIEGLNGPPTLLIYTNKNRVSPSIPQEWKERFPSIQRVIHYLDVNTCPATTFETQLQGDGPWDIDKGFQAIYTPGNTPGHICLRYTPTNFRSAGRGRDTPTHPVLAHLCGVCHQ